ncbi:MAG: hypothetical protein L0332_02270 [Chloroflexi bacterium]|nr:hypothetical protein [Chloroflexota bacterium]MCI0577534.1 hypothetical protein [Chloroflexota bacterium]MCI0645627.1 hypothetical protein [Chloroflexota bacterium]MCI0725539.1 hypothetical protein [Chloroflexota bacterium]
MSRQEDKDGMTSRELEDDVLAYQATGQLAGQIVEQFASAICRRGWQVPALIGLEAARPLAFLGSQLLWLAQPTLGLFFSHQNIDRLARLLEDPAAVEALIGQLETGATS